MSGDPLHEALMEALKDLDRIEKSLVESSLGREPSVQNKIGQVRVKLAQARRSMRRAQDESR